MVNKQKIEELQKGDTNRTMLHASVANEVINALNKMWDVKLPQGAGVAVFRDSKDRVTLDLSQAAFDSGSDIPPDYDEVTLTIPTPEGWYTGTFLVKDGAVTVPNDDTKKQAVTITEGTPTLTEIVDCGA